MIRVLLIALLLTGTAMAETITNNPEIERRPSLLAPAPKIDPADELPFLFGLKIFLDALDAAAKVRREREGEPLPPGVH